MDRTSDFLMKLLPAIRATLLLLLAAVSPMVAQGQRVYTPEFYLGAHGGMTMARQSFYPSAPQSMLNGMMLGVTAKYTEQKYFGLIAELNFVQRGWAEKFEDTPFTYSRRLNYLQLPLLTHIYFGSKRFRGYVNAGPEVAYLISSSVSANFDYRNYKAVEGFPLRNRENEQLDMPIKNRFDYGIMAGAGMEWNVKPRHIITLEARYYYGLGNIFPSAKKDVFNASRGWAIEILAGYSFRLK